MIRKCRRSGVGVVKVELSSWGRGRPRRFCVHVFIPPKERCVPAFVDAWNVFDFLIVLAGLIQVILIFSFSSDRVCLGLLAALRSILIPPLHTSATLWSRKASIPYHVPDLRQPIS